MDIPILSLLILIPLIGAIATLFMGGERQKFAKYVAGVFAAITLVLSLYVMFATEMGELSESYTWIQTSAITINFALAVDGLSILMVFLTALLTLLVIVFSAEEKDRPNSTHWSWPWRSDSWVSTWRRTTSCSTSCGRSP